MWTVFTASVAWGITFLATTYLLLPALHATAMACAYVAADAIQTLFIFISYHRSERSRIADIAAESRPLRDASTPGNLC
jgi:hypothetical protein